MRTRCACAGLPDGDIRAEAMYESCEIAYKIVLTKKKNRFIACDLLIILSTELKQNLDALTHAEQA